MPAIVYLAVVDDNHIYRDLLGRSGSLSEHHVVVARAANADQLATALTDLPDRRCDVIVLDLRTSPRTGHLTGQGTAQAVQGVPAVVMLLAAAQRAVEAGLLMNVPAILIHSQESTRRVDIACMVAGASGIISKNEPLGVLAAAVDALAAGALAVDRTIADLVAAWRNDLDKLTPSEAAVLHLAGNGPANAAIAAQLCVTVDTVNKHLASIRAKYPNINMTDLADLFGLRDLAPPWNLDRAAIEQRRSRWSALRRQLTLLTTRPGAGGK